MAKKLFSSKYVGSRVSDIPEEQIELAAKTGNYYEDENGFLKRFDDAPGVAAERSTTTVLPRQETVTYTQNRVEVTKAEYEAAVADYQVGDTGATEDARQRREQDAALAYNAAQAEQEYQERLGITTTVSQQAANDVSGTNQQTSQDPSVTTSALTPQQEENLNTTSSSEEPIVGVSDATSDQTIEGTDGPVNNNTLPGENPASAATTAAEASATPNANAAMDKYGSRGTNVAEPEQPVTSPGLEDYGTIRYNPLHRVNNYTYNVALHLITPETYKTMVNSTTGQFLSDGVLIASGGKYSGANRNPQFKENFFIEELDIQTIIGLNAQTQGSNAVTVNFDVIEPNSVTFLERLIMAANEVGAPNYLELIYALTIEFVGYDENGKVVNMPQHSKAIPIKITGIQFKVTEAGATYKVQAVPFNHQAYDQTNVSTPVDVTVVARTVADYFTDPTMLTADDRAAKEGDTILSTDIWVESWSRAVNRNQEKLVKDNNQFVADKYNVIIDDTIGMSLVNKDPEQMPITNTPMGNGETPAITYDAVMQTVSAGTSIISEINRVIRNSDYFLSQFEDPLTASKKTQAELTEELTNSDTLRWWKITPKILLTEYDHKRKEYGKEITFYVQPYNIYGSDFPNTKKKDPEPVKRYEYLFSGKNVDIISFDINYNTAYYVPVAASFEKNIATTVASKEKQSVSGTTESEYSGSPNNLGNVKTKPQAAFANASASANNKVYPKQIMAGAIQETLMNSMGGDMITLDMTIIGDPDYIKQDDIYIVGLNRQGLNSSLDMDTTEVYAEVIFKTPVDYDESTGLSKSQLRSKFSGFFRVTSIFNQFRGGVFTQKIEAVRIFTDTKYNETVPPKPSQNTVSPFVATSTDAPLTPEYSGRGSSAGALTGAVPGVNNAIGALSNGIPSASAIQGAIGDATSKLGDLKGAMSGFSIDPNNLDLGASLEDISGRLSTVVPGGLNLPENLGATVNSAISSGVESASDALENFDLNNILKTKTPQGAPISNLPTIEP